MGRNRIHFLAPIFCIDVCTYTVMSTHHHLVLYINKLEVLAFNDKDMCERWNRLYKGTLLTQTLYKEDILSEAKLDAVNIKIEQWRLHLCNISWFIRTLNESIAYDQLRR